MRTVYVPSTKAIYGCILLLFACSVLGIAQLLDPAPVTTQETFPATFGNHTHVYDGDTIQDVYVKLKTFEGATYPMEVLWPGVLLKGDTLYAVIDIRIAGIDTPEKRPQHKGRTLASLSKEKAAAAEATHVLAELLETEDFEFALTHPRLGKYAGRIVAEVTVGDVNVADYLIDKGLGYPYDGSTKRAFDEWYTGD